MSSSLITVVIPTHNRREELTGCLMGLHRQSCRSKLRVIVVDDASSDGDGVARAAALHGAHYFRLRQRRGAAFAKNVAIAATRSPYLLFVDSDVKFISDTCVESMVAALACDASIGAVGGEAICDERGRITHVFGRQIDRASGASYCTYVAVADLGPHALVQCDYIPTSNCMVPTELAIQLRGFDDSHRDIGHDKDFGHRLGVAGYRSVVRRDTVVLHTFAKSERPTHPLDVSRRTQVRFLWRHSGIGAVYRLLRRSSVAPEVALADDLNIARHEEHYRTVVLKLGESTVAGASVRRTLLAASIWNAVRWGDVRTFGSRHSAEDLVQNIAVSHAPDSELT